LSISQYPDFSDNKDIAKIANIKYTKNKTIKTLDIAPVDDNSAVTTIFMLILWETNLNGLRVLIILNILTTYKSTPVTDISIILETTIMKSI
jgi:hypothetical protein